MKKIVKSWTEGRKDRSIARGSGVARRKDKKEKQKTDKVVRPR